MLVKELFFRLLIFAGKLTERVPQLLEVKEV